MDSSPTCSVARGYNNLWQLDGFALPVQITYRRILSALSRLHTFTGTQAKG